MAVVADPEAKARPYAPPDSKDARVRSKAARLGLLDREYSKPYCIKGNEVGEFPVPEEQRKRR